MRTNLFLAVVFSLAMLNTNAQFYDDFEDCDDGQPISGDHWTDWGCGGGPGCAIMCVAGFGHSGDHCGLIPDDGTTDAVLDLGNKIFSVWCFSLWMYVPSNQEAYWNLQGVVPIGAGEWIVGNVFFNQSLGDPGVGLIDDSALGPMNFNFPHDEWFRVIMIWDISAGISHATWEMYVDSVEVLPAGTPFTNQAGDIPTSLGGIDFFSISSDNLYYLDDIEFLETDIFDNCNFTLDVLDNEVGLSIYPIPVSDELFIKANQEFKSISIKNILGQEVFNSNVDDLSHRIDMSPYSNGTYLVTFEFEDSVIIKKIIKE